MNTWTRIRLGFVFFSFSAFLGVVTFRLARLQILPHPELQNLARRQFERSAKKNLYRRPILDRNGEELAITLNAGSVFARPKLISKKKVAVKKIARLLGGSSASWHQRIQTQKPFVWLQRQVSEETARKIENEKIRGVFVEPENKRIYPNDSLAANVIGFTDIDGNGLAGLELALDEALKKEPPRATTLKDGRGNLSYIDRRVLRPEEERDGVRVTLDRKVQNGLEEELDRAMDETGARSAMGIVMDPYTGEIFALGQRPSFDANRAATNASGLSNRLISHLYEPGSTIKVLLAAYALEKKMLTPGSLIDCGKGELQIGNQRIREAEIDHRYSTVPLEKVIEVSSNIGAVRVGQAIGSQGIKDALTLFGLTQKTGIRLPAETWAPPKKPEAWTQFFQATVSFGQGIATTPLQMVAAYAPLANGGYMVRPKILQTELTPEALAQDKKNKILSPSTVDSIRRMMVKVTESGTGTLAAVPGIRVAGKTGTGQKYKMGEGYETGKYFTSFVGFLPAEAPQLLIGVMLDEPGKPFYASKTAAPLFKRVAERSLQILDRGPRRVLATSERVPTKLLWPNLVKAPIQVTPDASGKWVMPDLSGSSVRESLEALGKFFHNLRVTGQGYLTSQVPLAGSLVTPQTPVLLEFSTPDAG